MFWGLILFLEHLTQESASIAYDDEKVRDLLYFMEPHGRLCNHILHKEKVERGFGTNDVDCLGR